MSEFNNSKWIWSEASRGRNAVVFFRRPFVLDKTPSSAVCRAACDSHYYLYVNGKAVIWEGSALRSGKRGYYDEFDISKYLVKGNNVIVVYALFYGVKATDYVSMEVPGFIFECPELDIYSDSSFMAYANVAAYNDSPNDHCPYAGFDIVYDATLEGQIDGILESTFNSSLFRSAQELCEYGDAPFGRLYKRLTPNYTVSKPITGKRIKVSPASVGVDPRDGEVYCINLDRSKHMSPYFEINAKGLERISIFTDSAVVPSEDGQRTIVAYRVKYIAAAGVNKFTCFNDMYGSKLYFVVPIGVKVNFLGYCESSYGVSREFLTTDDDNLNALLEKATNTLTDCMRSSFIDTPERERALKPIDASLSSRAAFYAHDTAGGITLKALLDILDSSDGSTVNAFVPGDPSEVPIEGLFACSEYGIFAEYYRRTGDRGAAAKFFPLMRDYILKWDRADGKRAAKTEEAKIAKSEEVGSFASVTEVLEDSFGMPEASTEAENVSETLEDSFGMPEASQEERTTEEFKTSENSSSGLDTQGGFGFGMYLEPEAEVMPSDVPIVNLENPNEQTTNIFAQNSEEKDEFAPEVLEGLGEPAPAEEAAPKNEEKDEFAPEVLEGFGEPAPVEEAAPKNEEKDEFAPKVLEGFGEPAPVEEAAPKNEEKDEFAPEDLYGFGEPASEESVAPEEKTEEASYGGTVEVEATEVETEEVSGKIKSKKKNRKHNKVMKLAAAVDEVSRGYEPRGIIARSSSVDYGYNADSILIENALYYSACKAVKEIANDLKIDVSEIDERMHSIEELFESCYDGGYRQGGCYDDRTNALAVITGLAKPAYYKDIADVLQSVLCASPRFEWAVIEALIKMKEYSAVRRRILSRYKPFIDSEYSTLPETFVGGVNCRAYQSGLIPAIMSGTVKVEKNRVTLTPNVALLGSYTAKLFHNGAITLRVRYTGERVDVFVDNNSDTEVDLVIDPATMPVRVEEKTVALSSGKTKMSF